MKENTSKKKTETIFFILMCILCIFYSGIKIQEINEKKAFCKEFFTNKPKDEIHTFCAKYFNP